MSKKMQVHKRIVLFYMKEVLEGYLRRFLKLAEALSLLGLSRSHFFRYLRAFRTNPGGEFLFVFCFLFFFKKNKKKKRFPSDKGKFPVGEWGL